MSGEITSVDVYRVIPVIKPIPTSEVCLRVVLHVGRGLTEEGIRNAVRQHLYNLKRRGLIERAGMRKWKSPNREALWLRARS